MDHLISKAKPPFKPYNVAVLMGGWSDERDVSLSSGQGVVKALQDLGHTAYPLDPHRDLETFARQIKTVCKGSPPEVIFNILHGRWGEDGVIQGILETTGIPYTFSGVLGSSLAMNKAVARQIALSHGIRCPEGQLFSLERYRKEGVSFFPHVVKPVGEGSTVGIRLIKAPAEQKNALDNWAYGDNVLVEKYIPGREINVSVFGGKAMGSVEICFEGEIFTYEIKYTAGKARHLVPAPIHPQVQTEILEMASVMHKALQCKGVTRSDFRYDDTKGEPGVLYYLETNTQPGMTSLSLVPDIAAYCGWSYNDIVQWILEDAMG